MTLEVLKMTVSSAFLFCFPSSQLITILWQKMKCFSLTTLTSCFKALISYCLVFTLELNADNAHHIDYRSYQWHFFTPKAMQVVHPSGPVWGNHITRFHPWPFSSWFQQWDIWQGVTQVIPQWTTQMPTLYCMVWRVQASYKFSTHGNKRWGPFVWGGGYWFGLVFVYYAFCVFILCTTLWSSNEGRYGNVINLNK